MMPVQPDTLMHVLPCGLSSNLAFILLQISRFA